MEMGNFFPGPPSQIVLQSTADVNILRHMLSISGGIVDFGEKSEDRTITKKKTKFDIFQVWLRRHRSGRKNGPLQTG